jgi:hypothetical protein
MKPVSACPICQRLVCSIHLRCALAYVPDFKHTSEAIKEAQEIIRQDADETGHSCLPYTIDYWKRFDLEKERKRQRIKNQMDGFGYITDEEKRNIADKSLKEIRKKLNKIVSQDDSKVVPQDSGKPKEKEGFWEKLKKHFFF